jgi:hypothetical protein
MTKIKIDFTDFWHSDSYEDKISNNLYRLLSTRFDLEFSEHPDFLVYSCSGRNFLRYRCIRIFYTAENLRPNYNECDYAFSFDYPVDERNYRLPVYRLEDRFDELTREKDVEAIFRTKTKFCNFVYGNPYPTERREFFHKLCQYKRVDSPGPVLNNMGSCIKPGYESKLAFIRPYKFTIAFENSSFPGYTTEKIVHAMVAHTIPIYWGDPLVGRDFNPRSFINCHDYDDFDQVIERVIEIDNDDELYMQYLEEPYFKDNVVNQYADENNILDRFEMIFGNGGITPVAQTWRNHLSMLNRSYPVFATRKLARLSRQWLSLKIHSIGRPTCR